MVLISYLLQRRIRWKKYSKELAINVKPDPHQNFLKFKVKYVEDGDVGKEYNTALAGSKAAYEEFLGHVFNNMTNLKRRLRSFGGPGQRQS